MGNNYSNTFDYGLISVGSCLQDYTPSKKRKNECGWLFEGGLPNGAFPRNCMKWNKMEDVDLERAYTVYLLDIPYLAKIHQRTITTVKRRLEDLGVIES